MLGLLLLVLALVLILLVLALMLSLLIMRQTKQPLQFLKQKNKQKRQTKQHY